MWPCGDISASFKILPINWPRGGWAWDDSTSYKAKGITPGRVTYRTCKGCILCTVCKMHIRPHVKAHGKGIPSQLEARCSNPDCKARLELQRCGAKCFWTTFDIPDKEGYLGILQHKGKLDLNIWNNLKRINYEYYCF